MRFLVAMKIHIRFHDTIIFSPVKIHLFYGDETSLLYIEGCFGHEFSSPLWRRICGVEKNCEESFQLLKTILGRFLYNLRGEVSSSQNSSLQNCVRHSFEMKSNALHF